MVVENLIEIALKDIQVLNDVYPRDSFDNETVNAYALNLESLPPIVISEEKILVDGYHRLLAYGLGKRETIKAVIMKVSKDRILWEATKLNSKHGKQLTKDEKRRLAGIFYKNNGCTLAQISDVLAVSEATLSDKWLRDLIRDAREQQKQDIIQFYLACWTQEEIANKTQVTQGRIAQIINKFKTEEINKINLIPDSLQLFNVWNFGKRDKHYGLDFQGAIPGQIIENLLHYFTKPFDTVLDPMAGGGTTIDVCKKFYRRYHAYDLESVRPDIVEHDVRKGFPKEANHADFIFLDPPYFNMVFKDIFVDIQAFRDFLQLLAAESKANLCENGHVAILMEDMTELGNFCLSGDVFCIFVSQGLVPVAHVSCPLSTEQFIPQQIEKAKKENRMLGRNRDLYIFKKQSEVK